MYNKGMMGRAAATVTGYGEGIFKDAPELERLMSHEAVFLLNEVEDSAYPIKGADNDMLGCAGLAIWACCDFQISRYLERLCTVRDLRVVEVTVDKTDCSEGYYSDIWWMHDMGRNGGCYKFEAVTI